MPTLAQKAAYWERELLDLSKRNRMLHFRETKRSSLVIETPDFYTLYHKIAKQEQCLTFQHPIGRDVDPRAYSLLQLFELAGAPVEALLGDIHTNQRMHDQLLTLRSLRNRALLAFDEQGTNLLYLAFGFIRWYDGDRRTGEMNSPFLLVPVSLNGAGASDFKLRLYDDDIVINPTLVYALEQKKHFSFPEFDPDKDSFPAYIDRLIPLLEKAGMSFEKKCCLAILSFLKINMYLDLKKNRGLIESNPVLREIYTPAAQTPGLSFQHDSEPFESRFQVLSADSSQMDAISLSRLGRSFVLQGPPGTGKSQTITNIIAQALSDGKKVLFVSEKMAALQVVYRRLQEVGLGDFCLPLHDYKADKKQILRLIAKPLKLKKEGADPGAEAKIARLEMLKKKLNLYPRDMHLTRSRYQMSLYEAMGRLEEMGDVPACSADIKNPFDLDRLTVLSRQDSLKEYGRALSSLALPPSQNPWHGCRAEAFLPQERQKALDAVNAYLRAVNACRLLAARGKEEFGLLLQGAPGEMRRAASMYAALLQLPSVPKAWLETDPAALKARAEAEKRDQQAYRESKSAAEAYFVSCPEGEEAEAWLRDYTFHEQELAPFGVTMDALPSAKAAYILAIDRLSVFGRVWEAHSPSFWNSSQPVGAAKPVYEFLSAMDSVKAFTPLWLKKEVRKAARQALKKSHDHFRAIQRLQASLSKLGADRESAEGMRGARDAWAEGAQVRTLPGAAEVLSRAWEKKHSSAFVSMPGFSTEHWVRRFSALMQAAGLSQDFSPEQAEEQVNGLEKARSALLALQTLIAPFASLFPDQKCGICLSFLESLPRLLDQMPFPASWMKGYRRKTALELLSRLSALQMKQALLRKLILKDYLPSVFSLEAENMLRRFEQEYPVLFGAFKQQKRKDLQAIQACRKSQTVLIHDSEACRVLRAVCLLRDREAACDGLWEKNLHLFSDIDRPLPDDLAPLREKLEAFEQFCGEDGNGFVEQLTEPMLRAVPDSCAALKAIDLSAARAFLASRMENAQEASLSDALERAEALLDLYKEISRLYRDAAAILKPGLASRQLLPAMRALARDQRQALQSAVGLLEEREKEQAAYDALREQRISLLPQLWREDDPPWDDFIRVLSILSRDSFQPLLCQLSAAAPETTLEDMKNWFAALRPYSPEDTEKALREANRRAPADLPAREQAEQLALALEKIEKTEKFLAGSSVRAPEGTAVTEAARRIKCLADAWRLEKAQKEHRAKCLRLFGDAYAGWNTNWDRVLRDLEWWGLCLEQYPELKKNPQALLPAVDEGRRDACRVWAEKAVFAAGEWQDTFAAVSDCFEAGALSGLTQEEQEERLVQAADRPESLDEWARYTAQRQKIAAEGLGEAAAAFEKAGVPFGAFGQAYEKAFLLAWVSQCLGDSPDVTRFDAAKRDGEIREFRRLSREYLSINRSRLQSMLIDRVPRQAAGGEMAILKKELSKRAKIMPLRKLFRHIPYLLMELKPCFMMSPLSVSYFLDSDFYHFDMVIFDEASQIFPQDAIGAILRSGQAIIAGDTRQMPPTDFFSAETEEAGEDEEDDAVDDTPLGDSILEEADFTLTSLQLLWHYRSRDEQLIAFSNRHFYDGSLFTFPGNAPQREDTGVEYYYIPDGVYAARRNQKEAEACLRLIRDHYQRHRERSLGVVAFNEAQQNAIETLVWQERERDPQFSAWLDENQVEPFFIKNLENVQGDERDTIIFSICFARAADGRFRYNFGPLGKAGGERRLNVAVTRAKHNVKLVGSIRPEEIDLTRAKSEGARLLRHYVDYACRPGQTQAAGSEEGDRFAAFVARHLESQGYSVQRNVGRSQYTVDIAVRSPDGPARYMAAVQCDGKNYASARTACDREEIRRRMLENLNWRIINCWSADWFAHPEAAGKALTDALASQEAPREPVAAAPVQTLPEAPAEEDTHIPPAPVQMPEYRTAAQTRFLSGAYPAQYSETAKNVLHCIAVEQPICPELLYRRMSPLWDRQMVTSYVRAQVDQRIQDLGSAVRMENGYYVRDDYAGASPRTAGDREIDQIAMEELKADLAFTLRPSFGMERGEAIAAAARLMGYQHTGQRIVARLGEALDQLAAEGKVTIVRGKVQWREDER